MNKNWKFWFDDGGWFSFAVTTTKLPGAETWRLMMMIRPMHLRIVRGCFLWRFFVRIMFPGPTGRVLGSSRLWSRIDVVASRSGRKACEYSWFWFSLATIFPLDHDRPLVTYLHPILVLVYAWWSQDRLSTAEVWKRQPLNTPPTNTVHLISITSLSLQRDVYTVPKGLLVHHCCTSKGSLF